MSGPGQGNGAEPAELALLFRRASRIMARVYHRRDHAHHAQDHVLSILRERGSVNQRELLAMLDVRSASLSELLRKLEGRGLVTRERDPNDRRGFVVSATDAARDRGPESGPDSGSADSLFACLDEGERESLRAMLEKIIDSLGDDSLACKGPGGRGRGQRGGMGCRGNGAVEGRGGKMGGGRGEKGGGKGRRGRGR